MSRRKRVRFIRGGQKIYGWFVGMDCGMAVIDYGPGRRTRCAVYPSRVFFLGQNKPQRHKENVSA